MTQAEVGARIETDMAGSRPSWATGGALRVWLLTVVLAATAVALVAGPLRSLPYTGSPLAVPWWIVAVLFGLAEIYVAHLQFRREAQSFSLSEIPLVIGLIFLSPAALVLAQLVGAGTSLILHRRQSPLKFAFNLSHFCIETTLAAVIFHSLVTEKIGPSAWGAAILATSASTVFAVVMITTAISLSEGRPVTKSLPQGLGLGLIVTATNTSLGLLAATTLWNDPGSAWLLVIPTGILILAYRAYSYEREKHSSLEFLYESTRMAQGTLEVDASIRSLLTQAREMFRAEVASITLFGEDGDPADRTTMGPGDRFLQGQSVSLEAGEGVWDDVARRGKAVNLPRPIADQQLRLHFAQRGIFKDAMVAPLFGKDRTVVGTFLIGDRLGDVSTFDDEDLKLFETLANHASVSLENARLVERLQESLAHLTEMNRLKDDFVAAVSHELRTPLTSIQGYVKTLLRPGMDAFDPKEKRSFLEAVSRQSERLHHLIEDLLIASQLDAQKVVAFSASLSVKELASRVVAELDDRSADHVVELDFPDALPSVRSDEGKIHQILTNFVVNACKYTAPGTRIIVRGTAADDGITLSVVDEGDGIPADLQGRVFERFFQVDQSSTRAVGGTGLGLYICAGLAEAIGGRVWLDSSDANGSTFCLWIPVRTPASWQPQREVQRVQ
ncbi:MAG: ATP-binding protein [Actinomycetota bacterium]